MAVLKCCGWRITIASTQPPINPRPVHGGARSCRDAQVVRPAALQRQGVAVRELKPLSVGAELGPARVVRVEAWPFLMLVAGINLVLNTFPFASSMRTTRLL